MGYLLKMSYEKTADRWSNETGADGHPWTVDTKSHSRSYSRKPTNNEIVRVIKEEFFLDMTKAEAVPNEDGHFTIAHIEDYNGNEDPDGSYIADYYIIVEILKTSPNKVGKLGL